jgi:hypothetical protein
VLCTHTMQPQFNAKGRALVCFLNQTGLGVQCGVRGKQVSVCAGGVRVGRRRPSCVGRRAHTRSESAVLATTTYHSVRF